MGCAWEFMGHVWDGPWGRCGKFPNQRQFLGAREGWMGAKFEAKLRTNHKHFTRGPNRTENCGNLGELFSPRPGCLYMGLF